MASRSSKRPPSRYPSALLSLVILGAVRLSAAAYSIISDCDETFNYWEALHLVLFGNGLETWEYSPQFAIRSWAYIGVHAAIAAPFRWLGWSKVSVALTSGIAAYTDPLRTHAQPEVFYATRAVLALVSATLEARLVSAVSRSLSPRCGWILLAILASSAGLWSASVAFLPSTFTLYTTTAAITSSLNSRTRDFILPTTVSFALGALLGWPFSLVLSLPWVFHRVVLSRHALAFIRAAFLSSLIAIPIFCIDSYLYGRPVLVPLNIVAYNVLSGAGPELYGVEPAWFYFANLALNAGPVVLALSLTAAPLLLLAPQRRSRISLLILCAPFYLWLGLLSAQPHKEERFMFPAYTCMALNAALALDAALTIALSPPSILPSAFRNFSRRTAPLAATALLAASAAFGLLRGAALVESYSAPLAILPHAQLDALEVQANATLCYGKEWYRFPASFFLPESEAWDDVRWVKSEFDGMLPKPFVRVPKEGLWITNLAHSTRALQPGFNDLNREDIAAYVDADTQCDFLVDSDGAAEQAERRYAREEQWERVACLPMLDAGASRGGGIATTVARILWMPQWARRVLRVRLDYRDFCVLENKRRGAHL